MTYTFYSNHMGMMTGTYIFGSQSKIASCHCRFVTWLDFQVFMYFESYYACIYVGHRGIRQTKGFGERDWRNIPLSKSRFHTYIHQQWVEEEYSKITNLPSIGYFESWNTFLVFPLLTPFGLEMKLRPHFLWKKWGGGISQALFSPTTCLNGEVPTFRWSNGSPRNHLVRAQENELKTKPIRWHAAAL